MTNTSSIASYSPAQQARFRQQIAFIEANRTRIPGLVAQTARQAGCSLANVYSVLKGNTFNAEVVRVAFGLASSHVGQVSVESAQGQPLGIEGLRRLSEARAAEVEFRDSVTGFQDAVTLLKAQRRIYILALSGIESWLTLYKEDLPDQVATEIMEYLKNEASDPQMQVTPMSGALVTRILGSEATVDKASLDAVQRMIENGEIGPDGYPLPPALRTLEAWQDPDPEAPGQHLDEHGEPTYFLSMRDSNKWKPENDAQGATEEEVEELNQLKEAMLRD